MKNKTGFKVAKLIIFILLLLPTNALTAQTISKIDGKDFQLQYVAANHGYDETFSFLDGNRFNFIGTEYYSAKKDVEEGFYTATDSTITFFASSGKFSINIEWVNDQVFKVLVRKNYLFYAVKGSVFDTYEKDFEKAERGEVVENYSCNMK